MEFVKKHSKGIIATVCLLLVLAVLGMATFTFARYTTSDNAQNQATVAKWGYVVTVDASNLFGAKYGNPVDSLVSVQASGTSIVSKASTNVVAPGSTGSMTITVNGEAEVLSALTFDVAEGYKDVVLTKEADSSTYSPIKWTLKEGEAAVVENKTLAELVTALEGKSENSIAANTPVSKTYTLSWAWALDGGNDEADTILGQFANGQSVVGYKAVTEIKLDITATIRQIQEIQA